MFVTLLPIRQVAGDHKELPELFLRGHASEQVVHAVFDRKRCVLIARLVISLASTQGKYPYQQDKYSQGKWIYGYVQR